ncbi:hypothetical protein Bbelb_383420 [Branchiostoma belcheri]|nr:hypothetical protein Bbelb_383420 [Branchiostoma belcheri]
MKGENSYLMLANCMTVAAVTLLKRCPVLMVCRRHSVMQADETTVPVIATPPGYNSTDVQAHTAASYSSRLQVIPQCLRRNREEGINVLTLKENLKMLGGSEAKTSPPVNCVSGKIIWAGLKVFIVWQLGGNCMVHITLTCCNPQSVPAQGHSDLRSEVVVMTSGSVNNTQSHKGEYSTGDSAVTRIACSYKRFAEDFIVSLLKKCLARKLAQPCERAAILPGTGRV